MKSGRGKQKRPLKNTLLQIVALGVFWVCGWVGFYHVLHFSALFFSACRCCWRPSQVFQVNVYFL